MDDDLVAYGRDLINARVRDGVPDFHLRHLVRRGAVGRAMYAQPSLLDLVDWDLVNDVQRNGEQADERGKAAALRMVQGVVQEWSDSVSGLG